VANVINAVIDDVRAAVGAACTETKANGIYFGLQIGRVPLERKAAAGQLPLVILDWSPREGTEWSIDGQIDDGDFYIYFVTDDSDADADTVPELIAKAEAVRDRLYGTGLTVGTAQVIGYPRVSASHTLPLNQYFLLTGRPFHCVACIARVIAGVY
jgi:hypothetical protein